MARSTFYSHYNDKEDLIDRGLAQLFDKLSEGMNEDSRDTVVPAYGLFEHVYENRVAAAGLDLYFMSSKFNTYSVNIARRQLGKQNYGGLREERLEVMAQTVGGALVALLISWVRTGMKTKPAIMAELFYNSLSDIGTIVQRKN